MSLANSGYQKAANMCDMQQTMNEEQCLKVSQMGQYLCSYSAPQVTKLLLVEQMPCEGYSVLLQG